MEALKAWENLISSPYDQKLNTKYKIIRKFGIWHTISSIKHQNMFSNLNFQQLPSKNNSYW